LFAGGFTLNRFASQVLVGFRAKTAKRAKGNSFHIFSAIGAASL